MIWAWFALFLAIWVYLKAWNAYPVLMLLIGSLIRLSLCAFVVFFVAGYFRLL